MLQVSREGRNGGGRAGDGLRRGLVALAVLGALVSQALPAQADPPVPCPRLLVEFERCAAGDPCHTVFVHPFASPDFKVEAVSGIPYVFIRENGGAGTNWETIGFYRDFDQKWESLFGFDAYDRVTAKADPACLVAAASPRRLPKLPPVSR